LDFEQLLKPCYTDAVRFARALADSKMSGDDLLQDALIKAWRAFHQLREPERFKSWLLKIISNRHRSMTRMQWFKQTIGIETAMNVPAVEELSYDEKELVRLALSKVPLAQRETLVLFEVLEMTVAEIAVHQNVTQSAVKSRLARGRAKLREHYETLSKMESYHEANVVQIS